MSDKSRPPVIGIMANVDRYDQGRAALRVFKHFKGLGYQVSVGTRSSPVKGMDFQLDRHTTRIRRGTLSRFVRGWTHAVFFDLSYQRELGRAFKSKHTTLIPLWKQIQNSGLRSVMDFDHVFCPTSSTYTDLADRLVVPLSRLSGVPCWDPGVPIIQPVTVTREEPTRVAITLERPTGEESTSRAVLLARRLLTEPDIEVTLVSKQSSWPKRELEYVKSLEQENTGRVSIYYEGNYQEYLKEITKHHVVICVGDPSDLGAAAVEALYLGKAVVCYEDLPVSDFSSDLCESNIYQVPFHRYDVGRLAVAGLSACRGVKLRRHPTPAACMRELQLEFKRHLNYSIGIKD